MPPLKKTDKEATGSELSSATNDNCAPAAQASSTSNLITSNSAAAKPNTMSYSGPMTDDARIEMHLRALEQINAVLTQMQETESQYNFGESIPRNGNAHASISADIHAILNSGPRSLPRNTGGKLWNCKNCQEIYLERITFMNFVMTQLMTMNNEKFIAIKKLFFEQMFSN